MCKNKITVLTLSMMIVMGSVAFIAGGLGRISTVEVVGRGNLNDTIMIYDVHDLQNMNLDLGGHYALANHIDASETVGWNDGAGFEPVGTGTDMFTGTLDGRGYSITELYINRESSNQGLFGYMGPGGSVSNVSMIDVNITSWGSTGGLVGNNVHGVIHNSSVTGSVYGSSWYRGLLVGLNHGDIYDCYSTGNVTNGNYLGGLVGENQGLIYDSYSVSRIYGDYHLGGLVGRNNGGTIRDSYAHGDISGIYYLGGAVGLSRNGEISNVSSHGNIEGLHYLGGLLGYNDNNTVEDSFSSAKISGEQYLGGLIGYNIDGYVTNSIAEGSVNGTSTQVGGLIGRNAGEISHTHAYGDVVGDAHVGGLVGINADGSPISNSTAWGDVIGASTSSSWTGGLVGYNYDGYLNDSSAHGAVTGYHLHVGGLLGYNNNGVISRCHASGNVNGYSRAGGLMGGGMGGIISHSWASGDVTGLELVGGLAGTSVYVENSYATGDVHGDVQNIGGLVGYNTGEVLGSYATGNTSGPQYVGGLVGWNRGSVENSYATGDVDSDGSRVGGLVGRNHEGSISSSFATGDVVGYWMVGGLVGDNTATVETSYATGHVLETGGTSAGGLVGQNNGGTVRYSYSAGMVNGTTRVGGLVGITTSTISNSYSTAVVQGGAHVGGLVGRNDGFVTDSYSSGPVSGDFALGGLIGSATGGVLGGFWDNETSGQTVSAGGIGKNTTDMMTLDTFLNEDWDFDETWWMLDGETRPFLRMEWSTTIKNSHQLQLMMMDLNAHYELAWDLDLSGIRVPAKMWGTDAGEGAGFVPIGTEAERFLGTFDGRYNNIIGLYINRPHSDDQGLFGHIGNNVASTAVRNVALTDAEVTGAVGTGTLIGRVTGNANIHIENCYATGGSVTGDGSTGGLIGAHNGYRETSGGMDNPVLRYSFANVSVHSSGLGDGDRYGGLVGCSRQGTISNSYAWGSVTVSQGEKIGGLVGCMDFSGEVNRSYFTGVVAVTDSISYGGLVGNLEGEGNNPGIVIHSFWDVDTSGQNESAGGTGRNTTEMKTRSTFTDVGWNFVDIWWIKENITYPLLWWQPDPHPLAPTVVLLVPNGGEQWLAGTEEYISWTTVKGDVPVDHVDIFYSTDSGVSWTTIVAGADDTGSYMWTLPNVNSGECKVRVMATDGAGLTGEGISELVFEIIGTPPDPPQNLAVLHHGESVQTIYEDDAEGGDMGYITGTSDVDASSWEIRDHDAFSGNHSWDFGDGAFYKDSSAGRLSWLISPSILIPSDADSGYGVTLTFQHWRDWGDSDLFDAGNVKLSTGGADGPWIVIIPEEGYDGVVPTAYQNPLGGEEAWGGIHGWTTATFNLTGYMGETIHIRWDAGVEAWGEDNGAGWRIDDIHIDAILPDGKHNLLTWDASPHETIGEVDHYNLYRAEHESGPWNTSTLIDSLTADGSSQYEYIDEDKGKADDIYWWYVVRAVGINGLEEENTDAVQESTLVTMDIPLFAYPDSDGWNFISFNLVLTDTSPEAILTGIDGNYTKLMYYDSFDDRWLSYVPGRPDHFNNLQTWDNTMGIWIRVTQDVTLTVLGSIPESTDITLQPGWNMVGLPSNSPGNHDLPMEVTRIGYFDTSNEYNIVYTHDVFTFEFEPGKGYWVYNGADTPVIWTVDY